MERASQTDWLSRRHRRRLSAALLASTCLTAGIAHAQSLAPSTTPQGGVVAAGSASITSGNASTTIVQGSQRAIINWQSFNVGSAAKVQFVQPSASAIALNRVVSANPSVIAGTIDANGQIVLINQSGVVFAQGSQVNAESVVVATSDIKDKDFMAGSMVFSGAPNPGAKIINDGNITARDAGLVGLVAPQVANNGVITARLGRVVLAGADAFTLDLYGDRLVSLDVTKAVRAVDVGGETVAALVTNRGLILADGGSVTLTAQDADALVTSLVDAGGNIRADSAGGQAGTITLSGIGGNINISGNLLARGTAPGSAGGAVQALATGTVSLGPAAVIDASGAAGGGVVALGTDLARASAGASDTSAPRAAAVAVAQGARISADATQAGAGGHVVLLSHQNTSFAGTIAVEGGSLSGNGGVVEISSDGVIELSGSVLDGAANGQAGEILLDPATLVVSSAGNSPVSGSTVSGSTTIYGTDDDTTSYLTPAELDGLTGTIILQADSLISVESALNLSAAGALSLVSGGNITLNAAISMASGSLEIDAAGQIIVGSGAPLNAPNIALIDTGAGGIGILAPVSAGSGTIALVTGGLEFGGTGTILAPDGVIELAPPAPVDGNISLSQALVDYLDAATLVVGSAGSFTTDYLQSATTLDYAGSLVFDGTDQFFQTGAITAANIAVTSPDVILGGALDATGTLALNSSGTIGDAGTLSAARLIIDAAGFDQGAGAGAVTADTLAGQGFIGNVLLTGAPNQIGTLGGFSLAGTNTLAIADAASLVVAGAIQAGVIDLNAAALTLPGTLSAGVIALGALGDVSQSGAGVIDAGVLSTSGTVDGALSLGNADNLIGTLTGVTAASVSVLDDGTLTVGALSSGGDVTLAASGLTLAGNISVGDELYLEETGSGISQTGGAITAGKLSSGGVVDAGNVLLTQSGNLIGDFGCFTLSGGTLALTDPGDVTVDGQLIAGAISLTAGAIDVTNGATAGSGLFLDGVGGITIGGSLAAGIGVTLASAAAVTETSGGAISAGTLLANALDGVTLAAGSNAIGTLGAIAAGTGGFALMDQQALTIAGPLTAQYAALQAPGLAVDGLISVAGALTLASSAYISEGAGGAVDAALLTAGGVTASGDILLSGASNSIAAAGLLAADGSFSLTDGITLDVVAPVDANGITLSAPGIYIASSLAAPAVMLSSTGNISEIGGAIDTANLNVTDYGANTTVALTGTGNSITNLSDVQIDNGGFVLNDAVGLTIIGALDASNASLAVPSLLVSGFVSVPGQLTLESPGGVYEASYADIYAGELTTGAGSIGGALQLSSDNNSIYGLGNMAVAGNLQIQDRADLNIYGQVSAANAYIAASMIDLSGALQAPGAVYLSQRIYQNDFDSFRPAFESNGGGTGISITGYASAGTVLHLQSNYGVDASTGTLVAATLIGAALGPVALTGDNSVATLGDFNAGSNNFALYDNVPLQVSGNVAGAGIVLRAPSLGLTGSVDASYGAQLTGEYGIALGGTVQAGYLRLQSYGDVTDSQAVLNAGTLAANVSGDVNLTGGQNNIFALYNVNAGSLELADDEPVQIYGAALGSASISAPGITLAGALAASNGLSLTSDGALSQTGGAITASYAVLTGEAISLNGDDVINGALDIESSGAVSNTGALQAGTLTGNAGSLAAFGTADFGTIGSFTMADSLFSLTNTGDLTLAGPLTADQVSLTVDGTLTLDGGGLNITGQQESGSVTSPGSLDSVLAVTGSSGIGIVQTGSFEINAGLLPATLFILTNGADVSFAAGPAGLIAPSVDLVLNLGSAGGASGNIDVYHLELIQAGQTQLTGSIDGTGGGAAAALASIIPTPAGQYLFNGCAIGSATCTLTVVTPPPVTPPPVTPPPVTPPPVTPPPVTPPPVVTTQVSTPTAPAATVLDVDPLALYAVPAGAASQSEDADTSVETSSATGTKTGLAVPSFDPLANFDEAHRKRRHLDQDVQLPGVGTHDY